MGQYGELRFEKNAGQWEDNILYKASFTQGKVFVQPNKLSVIVFDSNNAAYHRHNSGNDNYSGKERYHVFSVSPYNATFNNIKELERLNGYTNYFIGNDKSKWAAGVYAYSGVIYENVYRNIDWEISSLGDMPKHSYIVHPEGDVSGITTLYKGLKSLKADGDKLYLETDCGWIEENKLTVYQQTVHGVKEIEAYYSAVQTQEGYLVSYRVGTYDKTKDLIIDPALIFSTYSGSRSDNWGMTSCYDQRGLLVSGGIVSGEQYPTTEGAYSSEYLGNWDCVVTKYDSLGQNMIFSTYFGGNMCEMPHSMTVNNEGDLIVFGTTGSSDFPVTDNAFQKNLNGGDNVQYEGSLLYLNGIDIFVSAFNSSGTQLKASTFIGGTANDGFNFKNEYQLDQNILYYGNDSLYANFGDCARGEILTDKNNNVYVASCTFSHNFPTTDNAFMKNSAGMQDAVVFKFDKALSTLLYSTYLGGTNNDAAYSLDLDSQDRVYVCGGTSSSDYPVSTGAYNDVFNGGSADAFISVLSTDGSNVEYSSFFGSDVYDQAFFIRLDRNDIPYIYGQTLASGYTLVKNAQYSIPNSGQFIAKLTPKLDSLYFSTVFGSGDGMINLSPSGFAVDYCERIYCAGWGRIFKYRQNNYPHLGTENMEVSDDAYMKQTDGMDFYIMSLEKDAAALNYATFFGECDKENTLFGNDHVDGGTSRFDRYGSYYLTICASCNGSQGMPVTENAYSKGNKSRNCNTASMKFSVNNDFAVADFDMPNIACSNTAVQFSNYSRGDSFMWDFGDGSLTSRQKNPSHTYSSDGVYTITLIVLSEDGCKQSDTIRKSILILDDKAGYLDTLLSCEGNPVNIGIENIYPSDQENVKLTWSPAEYLSDVNSMNPYATVNSPTLFTLIISIDGCKDTMYRFVDIDTFVSELPDTLEFCTLPYTYNIPKPQNKDAVCSWNNIFTDYAEMNEDNSAVIIRDTSDRYLYVRYKESGCIYTDSLFVKFTGIKYNIITKDVYCQTDATGSALIELIGDTTNVHYKWSCSDKDTCFVENLAVGTYTVTVYMENDTCYTQLPVRILAVTDMDIHEKITDASCSGICNGEISVDVSGGQPPYTYLWSNGSTNQNLNGLCEGNYVITVTDNTGCSSKKTLHVNNMYKINTVLTATENRCANGCDATITSLVEGGKEPYTYSWNSGQKTENLDNVCNGTYLLTVTDNNGCKGTSQVTVGYTDVTVGFEAYADKYRVYDGEEFTLTSTLLEGFNYFWTPSADLVTPDNYTTLATAYKTTVFKVTADDTHGCDVSDTVKVEVDYINCGKPDIFIPNAFSPNNDGKNDILYVSGDYIMSMDWIIYDRWGERVFHSDNINDGWDGRFRNQDCAAGVYYYKLEVKCMGGKTFVTGGDVTLIR